MPKKFTNFQKVKIARYYLHTQGTSYAKVALHFGATIAQVRQFVMKFRNEEYDLELEQQENELYTEEREIVAKEMLEMGANTLVNETIVDVIAEIRSSTNMKGKEKLDLLSKLTITMKRNQENHYAELLKQPDAETVILLMQSENPNLTPKEIITRWKRLKAQQK